MITFFDDRQLAHAPPLEMHNGGWVEHAEKPLRASTVRAALGTTEAPSDFGIAPLTAAHADSYLDFLQSVHSRWLEAERAGPAIGYVWPIKGRRPLRHQRIDASLGQYSFDAATPITEDTWRSAYWSAQTALTAVDHVLSGHAANAFALCRPPGHHAGADYLGGYCYLNNAAIAASEAISRSAGRVAILDIDYHHGNGTQDIFYERDDVFYVSIHADPVTDFPFFWGHTDECGHGEGAGATLNLPLPRGTNIERYRSALDTALEAIRERRTQFLIVSFGADTYVGDPISGFELDTPDFRLLGRAIAAMALPTVIVMEGGYAVQALGDNTASFLAGFG